MALGRPSKPLFELLREESTTGRRPASPAPSTEASVRAGSTVEPKPDTRAETDRSVAARAPQSVESRREARVGSGGESGGSRADGPSAAGDPHAASWGSWSGSWSAGTLTLPKVAVALGVAAVLVLVFALYAVGYSSGRKQGQREMSGTGTIPTITEPKLATESKSDGIKDGVIPGSLGSPASSNGKSAAPDQPAEQPSKKNPTNPAAKPKAGSSVADDGVKPVILSTGAVEADPRKAGLNYLVLATRMPRDEARELVGFLSSNGLEAVAVVTNPKVDARVDGGGRGGNNPDLFKVVALTGVTKEQYKSNDPVRQTLIGEAQRVGGLWKKSKVGRSDLSKTYWEVFVGDER